MGTPVSSQRRLPRWCKWGQGRGVGGCGGAWGPWKPIPRRALLPFPFGNGVSASDVWKVPRGRATQGALRVVLQEVDARLLREVCSKYFYDQCPAVAGFGEWPGRSTLWVPPQAVVWASPLPLLPPFPQLSLGAASWGPQEALPNSLAAREFLLRKPVLAAP